MSLSDYVKSQCIYSKLSEKPVVGQWEHLTIVFIYGYPMTLRGFYALTSKAVFGNSLPLSMKMWEELNAETRLLCGGLGHQLTRGREALDVIDGIRRASNWTEETANDHRSWDVDSPLYRWIEDIESQIAEARGLSLPGPRLR